MIHPLQPTSQSIHCLDKCLPELPKVRIEISYGENGPIPSDVVLECDGVRSGLNPRARIPQFRQSRRWAKMHGWAEPSAQIIVPLEPRNSFLDSDPTPDDIREKLFSKREVSFDQQRALPRQKRYIAASKIERPSNKRNISQSSSDSQEGSTGWISTAECWRFVKPTVIRLPRANTRVWPRKPSKSRKLTPVRHRESTARRSSGLISLPNGFRLENRHQISKRNSSTGNGPASGLSAKKSSSSLRMRSYRQNKTRARKDFGISLIPSIHDPLKDRAFSDECREMLRSLENANGHFTTLGPSGNIVSTAHTSSLLLKNPDVTGKHRPEQLVSEAHAPHRPLDGVIDGNESSTSGPICSSVSMHNETLHEPSSSVQLCSLAGVLHKFHSESPSLDPLDSTLPHSANESQQQVSASSYLSTIQPRSVARLPSARSVMSTDTLAGIEAQVQCDWPRFDLEPKKDAAQSSPENGGNRRSGPPPDIPLPELPLKAQDQQSDTTIGSDGSQSMQLSRGQSSATSVEFARHNIHGPRAEKIRARRLQDLARCRVQSPKLVAQVEAKPNLSKSTSAIDAEYLAPVNHILDELDRFPTVPDSRPNSMGSTSIRSAHSHQQSPGKRPAGQLRRMSTASSAGHRTKPQPQVLSQSNIFVVVDSDPVTARFRAGAMSPSQSIDGNSPERRSPIRVTRPSKLREMRVQEDTPVVNLESSTVLPTPDGQLVLTPTQPSGNSKRPATSESGQHSSSGDERPIPKPSSDAANKKPARFRKRRRWNSGDIDLIRLLQRDLEEYYVKVSEQDQKIKWQAHQIQMMTKVLAPVSHLQGVKTPGSLQESPELPPMATESRPVRPTTRNSWSNSRDKRQWNIGARSPLSIIEEQTLNTQAKGSLLLTNGTRPIACVGEFASKSMEEVKEGTAKRDSILYEPIALIEDEPEASGSRYYRC